MSSMPSPVSSLSPSPEPAPVNAAWNRAKEDVEKAKLDVEEKASVARNLMPEEILKAFARDQADHELEEATMTYHSALQAFTTLDGQGLGSQLGTNNQTAEAPPEAPPLNDVVPSSGDFANGPNTDHTLQDKMAMDDYLAFENSIINPDIARLLSQEHEMPQVIKEEPVEARFPAVRTRENQGTIEIVDTDDEMDGVVVSGKAVPTEAIIPIVVKDVEMSVVKDPDVTKGLDAKPDVDDPTSMNLDTEGFIKSKLVDTKEALALKATTAAENLLTKPQKQRLKKFRQTENEFLEVLADFEKCLQETTISDMVRLSLNRAQELAEDGLRDAQLKIQALLDKGRKKGDDEDEDGSEDDGGDHSPEATSDKPNKTSAESHFIELRWYDSYSDKEKDDLLVKARRETQEFLASKRDSISHGVRRLMRLVPEVVPECSYTTRKLALHILTNRGGKSECIYHALKSAGRKEYSDGSGKFAVNGIPFIKAQTSLDRERNTERNALSCGCNIDESLLDYIFYKNARATSYNPRINVEEDLYADPMHTRHRTFVVQTFKALTGLKLDDLYVGAEFGKATHFLTLVARVLSKVNQELPDNSKVVIGRISAVAGSSGE
ncbi:hypothetical protein C8F04DRAFT_1254764 [Mycena alexandri]|uniref:Uncharacterized protein n=1 Tax=Mycena alexandri TaxID=1745969 RepID=A0AAD6T517_9AGAR|nr:hypothetical protein C8F04DRAFT_1254764 [Mycena alexandri]